MSRIYREQNNVASHPSQENANHLRFAIYDLEGSRTAWDRRAGAVSAANGGFVASSIFHETHGRRIEWAQRNFMGTNSGVELKDEKD